MSSTVTVEHLLDDDEVERLRDRFGPFAEHHVRLDVGPAMIRRMSRRKLQKRRGEVVLLMHRRDGCVLLHTKHKYPRGTYRLPTGGIEWGESVVEAFRRESYEETGWRVKGGRLVGLITYELVGAKGVAPYASWLFRVRGVSGDPQPRDPREGISGFRWSRPSRMGAVAESLRGIAADRPETADWGRFRAVAHDVAGDLNA